MAYHDLLIRIKNAQAAKKRTLKVPYAKMDMAVAEVLTSKGYIAGAARKGRGAKRIIEIALQKEPAIRGVRLISVPSRAIYAGYKDIRPVKNGHGIAVLTTPKGVMDGGRARKEKVGGKVLFELW